MVSAGAAPTSGDGSQSVVSSADSPLQISATSAYWGVPQICPKRKKRAKTAALVRTNAR